MLMSNYNIEYNLRMSVLYSTAPSDPAANVQATEV